MKKFILLILFFSVQHCWAQCDDPFVKMLKGVWVKEDHPRDTIRFGHRSPEQQFELILADQKRPQGGPAGLYDYRAMNGGMLIHWMPSSNFMPQNILFLINEKGETITLGNFYRPRMPAKNFKFRKIKQD